MDSRSGRGYSGGDHPHAGSPYHVSEAEMELHMAHYQRMIQAGYDPQDARQAIDRRIAESLGIRPGRPGYGSAGPGNPFAPRPAGPPRSHTFDDDDFPHCMGHGYGGCGAGGCEPGGCRYDRPGPRIFNASPRPDTYDAPPRGFGYGRPPRGFRSGQRPGLSAPELARRREQIVQSIMADGETRQAAERFADEYIQERLAEEGYAPHQQPSRGQAPRETWNQVVQRMMNRGETREFAEMVADEYIKLHGGERGR
ncbi:hypothetical protein B0O99DRAFT_675773 [Bisporella sp. PMI_857]|nr:hypothetical protein B0O99DRAFT_675773 [Bisporella sp. PMI_857]